MNSLITQQTRKSVLVKFAKDKGKISFIPILCEMRDINKYQPLSGFFYGDNHWRMK